jgi:hypothetical protein
MSTIEHMADLRTEWKTAKEKYKKEVEAAKLKFNKGMGPQIDILLNKPGTTAAYKAAFKAHQYSIDYQGSNSVGSLKDPAKSALLVVLKKIEGACKTIMSKGDPKK